MTRGDDGSCITATVIDSDIAHTLNISYNLNGGRLLNIISAPSSSFIGPPCVVLHCSPSR